MFQSPPTKYRFHVKFALPKGEHSGIPASPSHPSHPSYFSFSGSTFNSAEILASPSIYWIDGETMGKPDKISMVFHGYPMLPARSKLYGMNIRVIMWYYIWNGRYFSIPTSWTENGVPSPRMNHDFPNSNCYSGVRYAMPHFQTHPNIVLLAKCPIISPLGTLYPYFCQLYIYIYPW